MEQIFVTLQEKYSYNGKTNPSLGFAARYNSASEKCNDKNKKQMEWAYRSYRQVDDSIFLIKRDYDYVNRIPTETEIPLPDDRYPLTIDNEALIGFKICGTTSRYSTSNKLWHIEDPRGFMLEISTDNMENILMQGTVIKGVIQGSCIWDFGKNGIGKANLKFT